MEGREELKIISYQLPEASTSAGANYEESQAAVSKADFANKMAISLKEMRESDYWLKILNDLFPSDSEITRLKNEKL